MAKQTHIVSSLQAASRATTGSSPVVASTGSPRPSVLAYLGKADDIQKRREGADEARVRSWSHGAVAALHSLARELLRVPVQADR